MASYPKFPCFTLRAEGKDLFVTDGLETDRTENGRTWLSLFRGIQVIPPLTNGRILSGMLNRRSRDFIRITLPVSERSERYTLAFVTGAGEGRLDPQSDGVRGQLYLNPGMKVARDSLFDPISMDSWTDRLYFKSRVSGMSRGKPRSVITADIASLYIAVPVYCISVDNHIWFVRFDGRALTIQPVSLQEVRRSLSARLHCPNTPTPERDWASRNLNVLREAGIT